MRTVISAAKYRSNATSQIRRRQWQVGFHETSTSKSARDRSKTEGVDRLANGCCSNAKVFAQRCVEEGANILRLLVFKRRLSHHVAKIAWVKPGHVAFTNITHK